MNDLDVARALRAASQEEAGGWAFPGQGVFRHLFVPFYLAIVLVPWLRHQESGQQFISATNSVTAGSTTLLLAILVVWLGEQLYPERPEWNLRPLSSGARGLSRLARDAIYLFGVTQLTSWTIRAVTPRRT
jgi:hypothetical protein